MMTLDDIKLAVDMGLTVHWSNTAYTVTRWQSKISPHVVHYDVSHRDMTCGLTHLDGITMDYDGDDFFIADNWRRWPTHRLERLLDEGGMEDVYIYDDIILELALRASQYDQYPVDIPTDNDQELPAP